MSTQWTKQWTVASHTSDREYIVSMREDGTFACACPAWKFCKAPKVDCKHIRALRNAETPEQLKPPTPAERAVIARAIAKQPTASGMLMINTGRRIYLED